jgi:hypothetical protein
MLPSDYQPFFTASVAASSALIGLLFVAVSVAPERIFGGQAETQRQAQAVSAFSALANVFFISMTSLIPGVVLGLVVVATAAASSLQLLGLLLRAHLWRSEGSALHFVRGLLLFVASAAIYGTELYLGVVLLQKPTDSGVLAGLLEVLLGAYAIGLGRAWQLLGAPRTGLVSMLMDSLERRLGGPRPPKS